MKTQRSRCGDLELSVRGFYAEFNALIPTNEAAAAWIHSTLRSANILRCSICKCDEFDPVQFGSRTTRSKCKHRQKIYITANSMFEGVFHLRAWLAALFMWERGLFINSCWFAELFDCSRTTAQEIFKKLAMAAQSQVATEQELVPSSTFAESFKKRSRATPALAHPRAEEQAFNDAAADVSTSEAEPRSAAHVSSGPEIFDPFLNMAQYDVDQEARSVYESIAAQPTPIHFDYLCHTMGIDAGALSAHVTMLELIDVVERLPGDWYQRTGVSATHKADSDQPPLPGLPEKNREAFLQSAVAFKLFLKETWQGCSRKYHQFYLTAYHFLSRPRQPADGASIIDICLRHPPISREEVTQYISPKLVTLSLPTERAA